MNCPDCTICEACTEKKLRKRFKPEDSQPQDSRKSTSLGDILKGQTRTITTLEEENRKYAEDKLVLERLESIVVRLKTYITKTGGSLDEALKESP
jgi:hypothetical protein